MGPWLKTKYFSHTWKTIIPFPSHTQQKHKKYITSGKSVKGRSSLKITTAWCHTELKYPSSILLIHIYEGEKTSYSNTKVKFQLRGGIKAQQIITWPTLNIRLHIQSTHSRHGVGAKVVNWDSNAVFSIVCKTISSTKKYLQLYFILRTSNF